jgi:hypothetical protein
MRPTSLHVEPRGAKATARHYIRDLVYGANDGIITTFAVVSGVAGGQLSQLAVLVVGAANLAADGVSMGVGNFLAIRADERAREADGLPELEHHPWKHGLATLLAFVVAGAIPLVPYVLPSSANDRLSVSAWRRSCVGHQGPLVAHRARDAGPGCRRRGGGLWRGPARRGLRSRRDALISRGRLATDYQR